jgi:eukaryotic-like serine/threonine-protein kinase
MTQVAAAPTTVRNLAGAPLPDKLFGYTVMRRLGQGAGTMVYAVCKPGACEQLFALKLVQRQEKDDDRFVDQLSNEYAMSRRFTQPGLRRCPLLRLKRGWGFKLVEAALMMDYIDGEALGAKGLPEMGDLLDSMIHTARALHVLHGLGFVHCDIKPGNILRATDGQTWIIDFGQTCRLGTAKDRIQGTPDYIAIEQVRRQAVSPRTDVFSLGATMYWLLTGKFVPSAALLKGDDTAALSSQDYASPRELRPYVPADWSDLVMRCVRMLPGERPAGMAEVLEDLEALQGQI